MTRRFLWQAKVKMSLALRDGIRVRSDSGGRTSAERPHQENSAQVHVRALSNPLHIRRGRSGNPSALGGCMKRLLLASLLFATASAFAQVSVGITIGAPPPPRVLRARPVAPGPDFVWVEGYWYPVGNHYKWHAGYWTRPPYAGAVWVAPHHDGQRWFDGYWGGDRGRIAHDHRWDHDHDRDYRHDHDHDRH